VLINGIWYYSGEIRFGQIVIVVKKKILALRVAGCEVARSAQIAVFGSDHFEREAIFRRL